MLGNQEREVVCPCKLSRQPNVPLTTASASDTEDFNRLCEGYRTSGGLSSADALACELQRVQGQGIGRIARWIVEERIVCVHWRGGYWVPRFQLFPDTLAIKPVLATVLAELPNFRDCWTQARWFSEANPSLQGGRPCDVLELAPHRVCDAARLLRFALEG